MLPATMTILEFLYTSGAFFGFLVNVATTGDAIVSLRWVKRTQAEYPSIDFNPEGRVAWTHIVYHAALLIILAAFVVFGLFAGSEAPANPSTPITPVGVALTATLIFVEAVIVVVSLFLLTRRGAFVDRVRDIVTRAEN